MAFSDATRLEAKQRANFQCVVCHQPWVEVHHICPQSEGGSDGVENAATLCGSCHLHYGANADLRKQLREMRDWWWRRCADAKTDASVVELSKKLDTLHWAFIAGRDEQTKVLGEVKNLLSDHLVAAAARVSSATTLSSALAGFTGFQGSEFVRCPPAVPMSCQPRLAAVRPAASE